MMTALGQEPSLPSWLPARPEWRPEEHPVPPEFLEEQHKMYALVAAGVVGGVFLGKMAYDHVRTVGMTDVERKGLLKGVGIGVAAGAIAYLLHLDNEWYANVSAMYHEAEQRLGAGE